MVASILSAALAIAAASSSDGIEGHWLHPERTVIVRLAPCGEAMCGTVTWASDQAKRSARKGVDDLVGARLLTNFKQRSNGDWRGSIFVPDLNIRASGKIRALDANRLKVSGCVLGVVCKSQVWTRTDRTVAIAD
jgi:uncharacterized protein (DUF2147 family)